MPSSEELLGRLKELVREVTDREGLKLYDLEFVGVGRQRTLRVFIDKQEGVSIDDCANVSRGVNLLLDVEDPIPGGAYELEVSSPGLERHLKELWHFQSAVGSRIRVTTSQPVPLPESLTFNKPPKIKTVEGELLEADDKMLVVKKDEKNWEIPRDIVHKAKVVFVTEPAKLPKQRKKKKR